MIEHQVFIGLEVHIELKTNSKMFCSCPADHFGKEPNTQVCPVCLGLPGALPVPNRRAIEWTVLAGLALGCKIPLFSKFDRKNYFYPDLPKGYQISQYDLPFAREGKIQLEANNQLLVIRIRRVHLEEDTAKLVHTTLEGKTWTLIDFNRAGVPLMEIVTEPDIGSGQEAKIFLKKLRQIVRYLGISDCDMEKGSMRLEANISLRPKLKTKGEKLPDYKVEVKNLNSFRFVERAIDYEIKRQIEILASGRQLRQETRGWDEERQVSYSQRWKETAGDYRYFPEPDIPPIKWTPQQIRELRQRLPELPDQKEIRFQKEYGLTREQVQILAHLKRKADYFEEAVRLGKERNLTPREIANVIINKRVDSQRYPPASLVEILVQRKTTPQLPLVRIKTIVSQVIRDNPSAVDDYKKGKIGVIEFLLGQVMKLSQGRIDPRRVRRMITKFLLKSQHREME